MSEVSSYVKPSLSGTAAGFPDTLPGGSADTGEAGTVSGRSGQSAPHVKAEGIRPPAKPVLTLPDDAASPAARTQEHGEGLRAEVADSWRNKPDVYTSAKAACRCLRAAAAELAAKPPYYLRLSDREFLQVYEAVEHDRSRTRKAIGKGLAEHGDLRASDPLWQILQDVMTRRMKGYRL